VIRPDPMTLNLGELALALL